MISEKNPLEELIDYFRRIPGVGKRSAERYAYAVIDWDEELQRQFGEHIANLKQTIRFCECCGACLEKEECSYCVDTKRDTSTICVVEHFSQIPIIERTGSYRGLYHVLGGYLQPLENKGPESLRIQSLLDRLQTGEVQEVILALNFDKEGEATAFYLMRELAPFQVRVTRLASGIPAGANLTYTDAATMALAISRRQDF